MSTKEKIIGLIFVSASLVFAYFINKAQNEVQKNIQENKYQTIGKVYKFESGRSFTHVSYYYFYNNLKYERWDNANLTEADVLNKFFMVELSTEEPSLSKILLGKEIIDSTEIVKAGFTLGKSKEPLIIPPHNTQVSQPR